MLNLVKYIILIIACKLYWGLQEWLLVLWSQLEGDGVAFFITGFPPYLENLEFCHFFFQAWKMEFGKNLEFNSKLWKNLKFTNSIVQASLFKMSFTKIILSYFIVISTLSTQTLIQSQVFYFIAFTWKQPGQYMEFCVTREVGTCICLNKFQDFYN